MCAYNEADYIEYSIRSVIDYVDELIVVEGTWKECYLANGKMRSDDGTLEILERLKKEFPKLKVFEHNDDSQLIQRDRIFEHGPEGDYWLWIIDADEVYDPENAQKTVELTETARKTHGIKVNSLVFINDFYTYVPIAFPRLFYIDDPKKYKFYAPNDLMKFVYTYLGKDYHELVPVDNHEEEIFFYHYSYTHSPERFMEKKRERTRLHGEFKWCLTDGKVYKSGPPPRRFDGDHPELMKTHPLYRKKTHAQVSRPETICIVQHSGIGNLLHLSPMIKALREIKPEADIHLLTWRRSSRCLEGMEELTSIVDQMHPEEFMRRLGSPVDYLIIGQGGAIVTEAMEQMALRIYRTGPKELPWTKHEIEYNMDVARVMGFEGPNPESEFPIFEYNHVNMARELIIEKKLPTDDYIVINASYLREDHWPLKHWGDENYIDLVHRLSGRGQSIVLVGAKEDYDLAKKILDSFGPPTFRSKAERDFVVKNDPNISQMTTYEHAIINMCGFSDDIKDTASIIDGSQLVIGNDGGLAHIAAALDIPTITIFTFTNSTKNRPVGPNAHIVELQCENRLICQHGRYGNCKCLDVPVDMVWAKVIEVLETLK